MTRALIVIDMQHGFDDPVWGRTTNTPQAERNVAELIAAWEAADQPVVIVRHDSRDADSPLRPGRPGNDIVDAAHVEHPALLVVKSVNSAFYGTPSLDDWLRRAGIRDIVLCGIQTNMCVETTARMAGNLGYRATVALDATRTFDLESTLPDGTRARLSAAELMTATALNLQVGGFATVASTRRIIDHLRSRRQAPKHPERQIPETPNARPSR